MAFDGDFRAVCEGAAALRVEEKSETPPSGLGDGRRRWEVEADWERSASSLCPSRRF